MHALQNEALHHKKILLIEQHLKNTNDRTWCFWEKGEGLFEEIVYRNWGKAWFHSIDYSSLKQLSPYRYKMIRGVDFYTHCLDRIASSGHVDIVYDKVIDIQNRENRVDVIAEQGSYQGEYVFNSIEFQKPVLRSNQFYMLQHFKGWVIETSSPAFNQQEATLMDFRVGQEEGTTFVYVMPFSSTQALVEYTLFTPSLLADEVYESALKEYVEKQLSITNYEVLEREFGIIPMTDYSYPKQDGRIIYLGTAGGKTKPSSGYTFNFIQKHVEAIVNQLANTGNPFITTSLLGKRFNWYDRVLLHVLFYKKVKGSHIFYLLFKRNKISRLFAFLDNKSTLFQEFYLLNTLPQWPFMKAGWKELFKR